MGRGSGRGIRAWPAAAFLLGFSFIACGDLEVVTNIYATALEARPAVERGWIPPILPAGAHDIREAHDNAGARRWGLFSFTAEDADALRSRLGPELNLSAVRADAPPRIEWWPILLRGSLDGERLAATGLKGYPVAGQQLVIAVNWNQRRAYYWSRQ
ncbi:MAG: hypothetical protein WBC51_23050 [Vicinamibacterales bacterium]